MKTVEEYVEEIEQIRTRHPLLGRGDAQMVLVESAVSSVRVDDPIEAIRRIIEAGHELRSVRAGTT